MKRTWNKLRRGEKGQALIIALILMLVGGLIIAPVLGYVGSGLKIGKDVHEKRMMELYAADAGVEDGLWYLQDIERLKVLVQQLDENGYVPPDGWVPADYADWPLPSYNLGDNINGKDVAVTVGYLPDDKTFKITSVATSADGSTTIVSYLTMLDFSAFLQNVITSTNEYVPKPNTTVEPEDKIIDDYPEEDWPSDADFIAYYRSQLEDATSYVGNTTIEFTGTRDFGPAYVDGDLTIYSKTEGAMLTLQGTVYVTGKLKIGTEKKDFILNLNNQTIFVEDDTTNPQGAVDIGGQTHIIGSGCIIAVGGINFQPNMDQSTPTDFMFVMSINDETFAHPSDNFNGSFAGKVEVQLQPGDVITWNDPDDNDLNFPGASGTNWILNIDTWEISLQ